MIIGDLTSEYCDLNDFITNNEHVIRALNEQARDILEGPEWSDEDEFALARATVITEHLIQGSDDLQNPVELGDMEDEKFTEICTVILVSIHLFDLEDRGLLTSKRGQYSLTPEGEDLVNNKAL